MEQQQLNELIRLARAGNSEAISTLVKAYHGKVKATVKSLIGDTADYRPVETHAFSNAFTHMDTLDDPADFESWLYSYVKAEADKYKKPAEAAVSDALKDLGDDNLDIPGFDNENTKQVPDNGQLFEQPQQDVKLPPLPDAYQNNSSAASDTDTIPAGGREISPGEFTRMFGEIPTPQSQQDPQQPKQREIHLDMPDHSKDVKPVRSSTILTEPDAQQAEKFRKKLDDTDTQEYDDDDDDYDEDEEDDEEEGKKFPAWILIILIVLLAIVVLALVMYIFLPHQYNTVAQKLNEHLPLKLPTAQVSGSSSSTAEPSETPEITAASVETEPGSDPEGAVESAGPEVSAEPTPDANATDQRSQIGTLSVNVDNLNIRDSASTSGNKVDKAVLGQTYPVYDHIEAGGYTWYRIGDNQWIADNGSWVTYQGN